MFDVRCLTEADFVSAYVPDQPGMSYQEALSLATVLDNNAASVLAGSIREASEEEETDA
jgi:hypothetical protein